MSGYAILNKLIFCHPGGKGFLQAPLKKQFIAKC